MGEARLEQGDTGKAPTTEGWFVLNVRDGPWVVHDELGSGCRFEGPDVEFPQMGFNVRVLQPGQPNGMYHAESNQEAFLVLSGECLLIVEGQERRLGAWDFVHLPPDVPHILVGAGDGPSVVIMAGTRDPGERIVYPVEQAALRHDAGVEAETTSPGEAYARFGPRRPGHPPGWEALPWAVSGELR